MLVSPNIYPESTKSINSPAGLLKYSVPKVVPIGLMISVISNGDCSECIPKSTSVVAPVYGTYPNAVPVVTYVLLSTLPSAFKNCADVPPAFIIELAVML